MKKQPKFTLMQEKDFKMLKALLDAGISKAKVCEVTGRSYPTVKYVSETNSFVAYKELVRKVNSNHNKAKTQKEEPAVTQAPTVESSELMEVLQNILVTQQRILDSLDRVVVPKRRFGV